MTSSAEAQRPHVAPMLVPGHVRAGAIRADLTDSELSAAIFHGHVVILKDVFDSEEMLDLRRALMRWGQTTPEHPAGQSPAATPGVNYHRIDDGNVRSSIPHIFHQYGLGTLDDLPEYLGGPAKVTAELMKSLQNRVAGTEFDMSQAGLRVKVLHYPNGGGFLAEHTHPLEPQRIGLITGLSRAASDHGGGSTTFLTPHGYVDAGNAHDLGDVLMFRYDMPHGAVAVGEGPSIDWTSDTGKWSLVLDRESTHGQSQTGAEVRGQGLNSPLR